MEAKETTNESRGPVGGGGGHMEAEETTNKSSWLVGGGGGREVVERWWLVVKRWWSVVERWVVGGQEVHRQWSVVERWQRCWDNRRSIFGQFLDALLY